MLHQIKAKLAFKQVKLAFAEAAAVELPEGKKCVNQASVQVGELTAEGAPGMIRWHCGGSSPADFAALNPPEGAKAAALVDWSIRPGCTDESVEALIAGANQIFTALAVPMLKSDNFTRDIKRTTNETHLSGEPFHSFRIAKVDGAVRTVIFSGISTEDYTGGVDIKDWIPQYHQAIYFGWSLAGLLGATGTPAKISDLLQARMEFNFTWNTKLLHGLKTLANTSAASKYMAMQGDSRVSEVLPKFGMMSRAASRVFRSQSAMWEMEFNGFQDIAEALVFELGMPQVEKELDRKQQYTNCPDEMLWSPLKGQPTDEQVSAIISAVGAISRKTWGLWRTEVLEAPALIPGIGIKMALQNAPMPIPPPMIDTLGLDGFLTPMELLKKLFQAVDQVGPGLPIPMGPVMVSTAKAFLDVVEGITDVRGTTDLVQGGIELRGMEIFCALPTTASIMAVPDREVPALPGMEQGPPAMIAAALDHVANRENSNIYMRFVVQKALAAMDAGLIPAEALPPPAQEMLANEETMAKLRGITYTDEDVAEFQDKFSEVLDIIKLVAPLVDFEASELQMLPPPVKEFGFGAFTELTGVTLA